MKSKLANILACGFLGMYDFLFDLLPIATAKISTAELLVIFVLFTVINIGLFYLNYLVLDSQIFRQKQYGYYALATAISIVVFGFGKYGMRLIFKPYVLMHDNGQICWLWSSFIGSCFNQPFFSF